MGILNKIPTWITNFISRKPVKLIGRINIHLYAVIEAIGWVTYSVLVTEALGMICAVLGMIVLGLFFHAAWYACEAVSAREAHSVHWGEGLLTWRQKLMEVTRSIVHKPTIPDEDWLTDIDIRIWYPAVYRFIWLGMSITYMLYNYYY